MKTDSIGIIGAGFVGQILKRYYPDAKVYDKNKPCDPVEDVLGQKVIFLAFNLTDNGRDSYNEVAFYPIHAPAPRLFVIKSTLIPGTTDRLQRDFPPHQFVYNPEFLTELTAWEDFTNPQFQILGLPHESLPLASDLFALLPDAPVRRIISPLDAELLKHAQNSYYALKVSWFNQLYDACQEIGSDYETVREIMVQNPWVGDSHSVIWHKGFRGFGTVKESKCLPKDLHALRLCVKIPLLDEAERYNQELIAMRGVRKDFE